MFGLLAEKGYSGYLSYEAPNPVLWDRSPFEVAAEGVRETRKLLQAAGAAAYQPTWGTETDVKHCKDPCAARPATDDPLFIGLFNPSNTEDPRNGRKAALPHQHRARRGRPADAGWSSRACRFRSARWAWSPAAGSIHVVAGYARGRVDNDYHQVFDPATGTWSFAAPFPLPCNHIALTAIGTKLYSFGGFIEQNRCPHSKCFVYDTETDAWSPIAGLSRPRGAASAIVLDGKIHILGGRDVRSVEWHDVYDPATDKYTILSGMRGSTGTQPFVGQRDHMGVAVVDGTHPRHRRAHGQLRLQHRAARRL